MTLHTQDPSSGRHEQDRIAVRPILSAFAGAVALIAIAAFACGLFLRHDAFGRAARNRLDVPVPTRVDQWVNQDADLTRHRAEADARLHAYEWLDRAHGRVRIPIERAMELISTPATRPAEVER